MIFFNELAHFNGRLFAAGLAMNDVRGGDDVVAEE